MNKIGILVVNYKNLEYTKNCISDLTKQINQNFELWIWDQNSTDIESINYFKTLKGDNIRIFINDNNSDLNRIWNYFYENCELPYLCFLNNDVRLTNNFTDDILKIFNKEPNVGAVIHVTNNPAFVKADHKLNYEILNPPLYQGWDFCLKREAYTKIPDSLRIFGGDDFLFGGLRDKGYSVAITYSSPIIHFKEKTRTLFGSEIHKIQESDNKNYHIERNKRGFKHTDTTMGKMSNKFPPQDIKLTQNKNCIFTTIIGDYDNLPKLEIKKENNWDYICFTDNKKLKSDIWNLVYVDSNYKITLERVRLSRYYKTNYHKHLLSYNNLIYTDARMKIIGNLNDIIKRLNDVDISFMKHPVATDIKQEMKRVLSGRLEREEIISKIKKRYEEYGYNYKNGLLAGGVLVFKNNEKVVKFFKEWWYEIQNYSYRDQLSLNFVLSRNPELIYHTLPFNNTIGSYFKQTPRKSKRLTF
ncbi:MAG: glycosyltransferase family 2 protein [bacterium]